MGVPQNGDILKTLGQEDKGILGVLVRDSIRVNWDISIMRL